MRITLKLQRRVNKNNGQGLLKAKINIIVDLGLDYPPGPAQLAIYDQIIL